MAKSISIAIFILLELAYSPYLAAQADTLLPLPEVKVIAARLRNNPPGERTEKWDSTNLTRYSFTHLAELLSRESGVFIKSYGTGSIATSSFRGGSAGHTAVTWNGLPLQNPMLGQLDLSLLPVAFIDEVQLQYGGNSPLWGSGAIGGLIALSNLAPFNRAPAIELQSTLGSFGQWDQQIKLNYHSSRMAGSTRFFHQQATNDFPYKISGNAERRRQSHAQLRQTGLFQDLYWNPGANQQLALHLWWQEAERAIPPTTTQNRSTALQADEQFRTALHWSRLENRWRLQARTGIFREVVDYQDELLGVATHNAFWNLMSELEGEWQFHPGQQLHWGLSHLSTLASSDAYQDNHIQHQSAIFGALNWQLGDWEAQISGRQALADGKAAPLVAALGIEGPVFKWLTLKTKISRNYRLPTLNDRYWHPGGNPELRAEQGWSQELGFHALSPTPNPPVTFSMTVFNRNIDNWIHWIPRPGQSFWVPQNVAKVWSRGMEYRIHWKRSLNKLRLGATAGYDYIRSTNEKAIPGRQSGAGEQLIYIPVHQAFLSGDAVWKGWKAGYQHQFTGPVAAITDALSGYRLAHLQISRTARYRFLTGTFFFHINNLWNTDYRVIERRPMPGRHYQTGLKLKIGRPTGSEKIEDRSH